MSEAHVTTGAAAPVGGLPVLAEDMWTLDHEIDTTANDSDKTFTIPANEEWHVGWIFVDYTASADVGNRQLVIQFLDAATNLIGEVRAGAVIAAEERRYFTFGAGLADLMAFRDTDWLMTPLPVGLLLQTDFDIRVYDNNAVAANADDMSVVINFARRIP